MSNFEKDNRTYEKLIQALDYKYLKYSTPKAGEKYTLGSANITILGPVKEYDNPNDSSIVIMIKNGDNKFLFTGDAEEIAEKDILKDNPDISANVYKVGHHGSKTSTCDEFFKAVDPQYAVISCAEGNSYGHPHAQTLNTLRMNGVKTYRTDESGTIVATSDGKSIKFNVPASESWKAGEPVGTSEKKVNDNSSAIKNDTPNKSNENTKTVTYVLNVKSKKFHRLSCKSLPTKNRQDSYDSRDEIISKGYSPCGNCNP